MKKKLLLLLIAAAVVLFAAGCSRNKSDVETGATEEAKKIVVGATPTPHAEILDVAKEVLAEEGYELEIVEFTDYIQPNKMLESKELDANYFQHKPYLDDYNEENKQILFPSLPSITNRWAFIQAKPKPWRN